MSANVRLPEVFGLATRTHSEPLTTFIYEQNPWDSSVHAPNASCVAATIQRVRPWGNWIRRLQYGSSAVEAQAAASLAREPGGGYSDGTLPVLMMLPLTALSLSSRCCKVPTAFFSLSCV